MEDYVSWLEEEVDIVDEKFEVYECVVFIKDGVDKFKFKVEVIGVDFDSFDIEIECMEDWLGDLWIIIEEVFFGNIDFFKEVWCFMFKVMVGCSLNDLYCFVLEIMFFEDEELVDLFVEIFE